MTKLSLFNSPLLLGFEDFERVVDRISKAGSDGYPPYNVEQLSEHRIRITVAVAGFGQDDLTVQVEDNQLVVRGKRPPEPDRVFLHQGIAARQFQRSFVLADGIEVTGAAMDKGLLHIDLERPIVQPTIRTIEISSSDRSPQAQAVETAPARQGNGRKGRNAPATATEVEG